MKKYYINVPELVKLGFGGRDKCYALLKKVRADLEAQGYEMPAGIKAPRAVVLRKIGLIQEVR